jgi:hypothetical protein
MFQIRPPFARALSAVRSLADRGRTAFYALPPHAQAFAAFLALSVGIGLALWAAPLRTPAAGVAIVAALLVVGGGLRPIMVRAGLGGTYNAIDRLLLGGQPAGADAYYDDLRAELAEDPDLYLRLMQDEPFHQRMVELFERLSDQNATDMVKAKMVADHAVLLRDPGHLGEAEGQIRRDRTPDHKPRLRLTGEGGEDRLAREVEGTPSPKRGEGNWHERDMVKDDDRVASVTG